MFGEQQLEEDEGQVGGTQECGEGFAEKGPVSQVLRGVGALAMRSPREDTSWTLRSEHAWQLGWLRKEEVRSEIWGTLEANIRTCFYTA